MSIHQRQPGADITGNVATWPAADLVGGRSEHGRARRRASRAAATPARRGPFRQLSRRPIRRATVPASNCSAIASITIGPPPPPPPTQWVKNPSVESGLTGWTGLYNKTSKTSRVAGGQDGSYAVRSVNNSAGAAANGIADKPHWIDGTPGKATVAGKVYTASAWVKADTVGQKIVLFLRETNSAGKTEERGSEHRRHDGRGEEHRLVPDIGRPIPQAASGDSTRLPAALRQVGRPPGFHRRLVQPDARAEPRRTSESTLIGRSTAIATDHHLVTIAPPQRDHRLPLAAAADQRRRRARPRCRGSRRPTATALTLGRSRESAAVGRSPHSCSAGLFASRPLRSAVCGALFLVSPSRVRPGDDRRARRQHRQPASATTVLWLVLGVGAGALSGIAGSMVASGAGVAAQPRGPCRGSRRGGRSLYCMIVRPVAPQSGWARGDARGVHQRTRRHGHIDPTCAATPSRADRAHSARSKNAGNLYVSVGDSYAAGSSRPDAGRPLTETASHTGGRLAGRRAITCGS